MTVDQLYTLTDRLAKTDSTMFPEAEKLQYFNIAKDLLSAHHMAEEEDRFEGEYTKTTVADQSSYEQSARIHHVNWLKIDYGDGFIPARYKPEAEQITDFGNELEGTLDQWDASNPIYWYKGKHLFVAPAPTAAQAGADRLKVSQELYAVDLSADDDEPDLPLIEHPLLATYSAWRYHTVNGEDSQAAKLRSELPIWMTVVDIDALNDVRSLQEGITAGTPFDTGDNY